ncbi:like-Sm domain-containing protein [Xylaria sp. CBS 124048]|nr:like-Sm domain-containing protein [Xylaria sp. CBS 124048]
MKRDSSSHTDNVISEKNITANLVLESTVERIFALAPESTDNNVKGYFADKSHGLFLIRGENVLILGEIDLDKEDDPPTGYQMAEYDFVEKLSKEQKAKEKAKEKRKLKALATLGFEGENMGEALL